MSGPALEEVGHGTFAYLQKGGWGFSNAGLVTSEGASLLVDTLYDVRLTQRMLEALRRVSDAAFDIGVVVNTHANGDHCWGNQALPGATIVSSRATAEEMLSLSPRLMDRLVRTARAAASGRGVARWPLSILARLGIARARSLGDAAPFIVNAFGAFDFGSVTLRPPTQTFEGELVLTVGSKQVRLIQVGPAHTRGDTIVYVPEDRVVFTGDILFMGSHPIMWEGPVENWIRACDVLLGLDVDTVVPGHGPVTSKAGVTETRDYWVRLDQAVRAGHATGASAQDVAMSLLAGDVRAERERMIVNVDAVWRSLSGDSAEPDPLAVLARMALFERHVSSFPGKGA
jgi:glyoxylase-like metal-dependent hydrolase (beta-lactamase superfamily II)